MVEVYGVAEPGYMVRLAAWDPGWLVYIDGEEASLQRVDCALQGVWISKGEHIVEFKYRPRGYLIGRWINLGTVVLLLGWLTAMLFRKSPIRV